MRVDSRELPPDDWHHYLRVRDLLQLLSAPPVPLRGPVLEIGSGDGVLTEHLARTFGDVVPTDVLPRKRGAVVCIADAQRLPFKSGHFNLVFSSNVLEHIPDLHASLAELRRVTASDAVMLHTMPTPVWKLLQFAAHPLNALNRTVLRRLLDRAALDSKDRDGASASTGEEHDARDRGVADRIRRILWPAVHGTSRSHLEELLTFQAARWRRAFAAAGLEVFRTDSLFLHSPYRLAPYQAMLIRELISRAGLSSVNAYWVRRAR